MIYISLITALKQKPNQSNKQELGVLLDTISRAQLKKTTVKQLGPGPETPKNKEVWGGMESGE